MRLVAVTAVDDIRNAAGLASLTLALIGFFTNRRADTLRRQRDSIPAFTTRTLGDLLPEAGLLVVTLVALVAMAPLLDAFALDRVGHVDGAVPTLFTLIWLCFGGVALTQVYLIEERLRIALENRAAEQKAKVPAQQ
jgi:hypothetical protein